MAFGKLGAMGRGFGTFGVLGTASIPVDPGAALIAWDDSLSVQQLLQWDDANGNPQYLEWDI